MLAFLQTAAIYVAPFLAVITLIVTIHELGHFLVARACGVAVDRFSIGFGRAIASVKDRWGVEWRIGWLPLGGYVRFAGDDNAASVPDEEDLDAMRRRIALKEGASAVKRYFHFKPLWQRALIVFAGPATNFLLAIALFAILFTAMGEPVTSMRITDVVPGSPAASAGVRAGDVVLGADGRRLSSFDDLAAYVRDRPGQPMSLSVERAGHDLVIPITPEAKLENNPAGGQIKVGLLGVASQATMRRDGPVRALVRGTETTWDIVAKTGYYVGRMVEGKSGWPFAGFIGTAHIAGALTTQAVSVSHIDHVNLFLALAVQYVTLSAFLSVSVGLVNLLPIPILDGGHLLFYAYEAVARRPLALSVQAAGYRVGLALLVGLMLFTTWHDLRQMQVFHVLGALFS
ncbi:MAG: M50 family metallopeptidase [Caulobacteraceae bacterium]